MNLAQIFPAIFEEHKELAAIRLLRKQLTFIREFVMSCRDRETLLQHIPKER